MEIKTKTTVMDAEHTTANARYILHFSVSENTAEGQQKLQVVEAQVWDKKKSPTGIDGQETEQEYLVGKLSMQYGYMVPNQFPYTEKYGTYVNDFMEIINTIETGLSRKKL